VKRWRGIFFRILQYKTRLWTNISSDIAEVL